ncbi:hypothetical protein BZG35_03845 [Brevundimonas sp. LM2]|nr:hypothetical protein BZG35_03845 [Brevundimonas sp. LM2]
MPLFNSSVDHLRRAIESVLLQSHQAWELIMIDDGSTETLGRELADQYSAADERIVLTVLDANQGIAGATNQALALASGEFVAFLDHDDVLHPHAIALAMDRLAGSDADACYTDQSSIGPSGEFRSVFFKPDFSPTMLLGVMYIGHLLVVRTETVRAMGGFDPAFNRIQDYEFMLRLSERSSAINHIADILYQWRMVPGSIAADPNSKGAIEPLQALAVNAHLERRGLPIKARPHAVLPHRLVLEPAFDKGSRRPTVAFVVRDRGSVGSNSNLMEQVLQQNPEASIRLVGGAGTDRGSLIADVEDLLQKTEAEVIVYVDAGIHNSTANDWLDYLLMHLADVKVFAAGPHVVDEDDRVISAGWVLTSTGLAPAMSGLAGDHDGHGGSLACDREVSVLSDLAFAFKVSEARAAGGFNLDYEGMLHGMADLSLRVALTGARLVAVSGARVTLDEHDEEKQAIEEIDALIFRDQYRDQLENGDPYFSRGFAGDATFRAEI